LVIDGLKLRLPLFKEMEEKLAYSQFSRTLSTLVEGGIPLMDGLRVTVDSLENKEMNRRFEKIIPAIESGDSFSKALKAVSCVPKAMVKIVHVGEESGELGKMLFSLSEQYEEDVSTITSTLTAMIEPVLFLLVAGTIGALLVALLLPVLSAASNIR
ncbi:type II secretion system F family protein, partial [bacterium]|nr:type II secretion system F family protein [bacterium]